MNNVYGSIIKDICFTEYDKLRLNAQKLEIQLMNIFPTLSGFKRIGSSVTRTMRSTGKDLDYFMVFEKSPSFDNMKSILNYSDLQIHRISHDEKYNYSRFSGRLNDWDYVLVPIDKFEGTITTYPQDAYFHPEFINKRKRKGHENNVLLTKYFFDKAGLYNKVKGIGSEFLILKFNSFGKLLKNIVSEESIRVNFSGIKEKYSESRITIDYPFLGRRSLTDYVSKNEYKKIQGFAKEVLEDPTILK